MRRGVMDEEAVRSNEQIVGYARLETLDWPWTIAHFRPGPAFALIAPPFEKLRELEGNDDGWLDALEEINALQLTIGNPPRQIRDLKPASDSRVEFKDCI